MSDNQRLTLLQVLEQEYRAIHKEADPRDYVRPEKYSSAADGDDEPAAEQAQLARFYACVGQETPQAALCLSGGGIRSATFCLGVIQGLAKRRLLDKFDYLSTVSGGGYIGSWLSAWIHHDKLGSQGVFEQLEESTATTNEPAQIKHLRDYSNDLTPRVGLFSVDVWTWIAAYLRNLLLTWLVFIPLLALPLLAPRYAIGLLVWLRDTTESRWQFAVLFVGLIFQVWAIARLDWSQPSLGQFRSASSRASNRQGPFLRWTWAPLMVSALFLPLAWGRLHSKIPADHLILWFIGFQLLASLLGWLANSVATIFAFRAVEHSESIKPSQLALRLLSELLVIVPAAVIGGWLMWRFATWDVIDPARHVLRYVCLAPTLYLSAFLLGGASLHALANALTHSNEDLEWTARAAAWSLIAMLAWTAVSAVVLFGPILVLRLYAWSHATAIGAGGVGGFSGILVALLGMSPKTPANDEEFAKLLSKSISDRIGTWARQYTLQLAAPLFILALAIGLSFGNDWLMRTFPLGASLPPAGPRARHPADEQPSASQATDGPESDCDDIERILDRSLSLIFGDMSPADKSPEPRPEPSPKPGFWYIRSLQSVQIFPTIIGWTAILSAFTFVSGLIVNVNKFSLNGLYRERLVRAYLAASRSDKVRNADGSYVPFTGFDPEDDIRLYKLPKRPLHVINMALNLAGGSRLAWQERKAESFTATALHCGCGSDGIGYRSSKVYGGGKDQCGHGNLTAISLGTAVAISGAAASPNMGYNSSTIIAFLMMLFNVRLGAWLGNPGAAGERRWPYTYGASAPRQANRPFVDEALALTDDTHPYVNLSDGGHFDNLGLYEMLRRRCRYIVVCDAGHDPSFIFEDLGNAVRKIYIDMGVQITFDQPIAIYPRQTTPRPAKAGYCATATIKYSEVDKLPSGAVAPDGKLLYIKPAYYGDEPADICSYAKQFSQFPHDTTLDQFFTESQFESYRGLGFYAIETICTPRNSSVYDSLEALFKAANS